MLLIKVALDNGVNMTTFTTYPSHAKQQDLDKVLNPNCRAVPDAAVLAFSDAFNTAIHSGEKVCYVKNGMLIEQQKQHTHVVKNVSDTYVVPHLKHSVFKRKKKHEVGV